MGSAATNNGYYGRGYGLRPYAYPPTPVYVQPAPALYYRGDGSC